MKNPILSSSAFLFLLIINFSCAKKPSVGFNLDRVDYSAGELVTGTNFSSNATHYEWRIYSNDSLIDMTNDAIPNYRIPLLRANGVYSMRLTAYSKNDRKTSQYERNFVVKSLRGSVNIYGSALNNGFKVEVDGELLVSNATMQYYVYLPVGLRYVKVTTNSGKAKSITFNISQGAGFNWNIY